MGTRRSDAEQNRARILDAARDALATSSDATMHSIAQKAGVGQGTLYRHFPTREALVLAVYQHDVGELVSAASALLGRVPWIFVSGSCRSVRCLIACNVMI